MRYLKDLYFSCIINIKKADLLSKFLLNLSLPFINTVFNKINITYNFNAPKSQNPGNNKSDKYYLSLINNSSSNIFNSTNEASIILNTNHYNIY